jgi:eukaryotic-like serine/threonine-protein kinase
LEQPSTPSPLALAAGLKLGGKYRLERPAGFGGMAELWVAKNAATAADVCIKVLVFDRGDDESVERFRREAYAAARLSHRAIVRVFDLVELDEDLDLATGGRVAALAMVMELLRGETLGDHLMKRGKLSVEETLDVAIPVLSALAHAHRAGIVHRDVKPDNVFLAVDPDGHVIPKVLDFGVSKVKDAQQLTLDGVMLGTPSFMSPEQVRTSREVDARSDIFSAGILIYMMLTGENPFQGDTFHGIVEAIVSRAPEPVPELPRDLWAVLEKALAKDPALRYADATEFGIALRRASGRATITESGGFAPLRLPADSAVSVPPVDTGAVDTGARPSADAAALIAGRARRRGLAIVGVACGAALVLVFVALVRGGGSSSASGGTGGPAAPAVVTERAQAAAGPEVVAEDASALPVEVAPAPDPEPALELDLEETQAAATKPAPRAPAAPRRRAPPPPPTATATAPREIARDPGF